MGHYFHSCANKETTDHYSQSPCANKNPRATIRTAALPIRIHVCLIRTAALRIAASQFIWTVMLQLSISLSVFVLGTVDADVLPGWWFECRYVPLAGLFIPHWLNTEHQHWWPVRGFCRFITVVVVIVVDVYVFFSFSPCTGKEEEKYQNNFYDQHYSISRIK